MAFPWAPPTAVPYKSPSLFETKPLFGPYPSLCPVKLYTTTSLHLPLARGVSSNTTPHPRPLHTAPPLYVAPYSLPFLSRSRGRGGRAPSLPGPKLCTID